MTHAGLPVDYAAFLESLKSRVQQTQTRAMLSVNRESVQLYWDIGQRIVKQRKKESWDKITDGIKLPHAVAEIPWGHNV